MADSDPERASYLPWLMAALILVIGGAKLDAARPFVGRFLALAVPVVAPAMGIFRLREGHAGVERAAMLTGGVAILAGEICVAGGFLGVEQLRFALAPARLLLYGAVLAALFVHTASVRRGVEGRFAGFIGIAAVFGIYLSSHTGKDVFGSVFVAFLLALVIGGGAGVLAGEVLARVFKKA